MADETGASLHALPKQQEGSITFLAVIPASASAWTVSGDKPPSAKLKLEIPSSQFNQALELMRLGPGQVLKVQVTIED